MELGRESRSVEIVTRDRNRAVGIDCALSRNGDYILTAQREVVEVDESGSVPPKMLREYVVQRSLSQIGTVTVFLPGLAQPVSVLQLAAGIEQLTDLIAAEELAKRDTPQLPLPEAY